jgi:hypothetical protein
MRSALFLWGRLGVRTRFALGVDYSLTTIQTGGPFSSPHFYPAFH